MEEKYKEYIAHAIGITLGILMNAYVIWQTLGLPEHSLVMPNHNLPAVQQPADSQGLESKF
jgi:hypothetical protein